MQKFSRTVLLDAFDVSHWVALHGSIDFETFHERFTTDLTSRSAQKNWQRCLKCLEDRGAQFEKELMPTGQVTLRFNGYTARHRLSDELDELSISNPEE